MGDPNTEIGGTGASLPTTSHTALAALHPVAGVDAARREADRRRLVDLYWKPVYCLIRRTWATTNEDAKDLTQDFFADVVLDPAFAGRYVPDKGSFRAYLKGALRNFLAKRTRDERREKRGGHARIFSLDLPQADLEALLPDADALPPDEVFDAAWRHAVLDRATRLLQDRLTAQGKRDCFEVFRRYDLDPEDGASYDTVGRALGLSADDVKNRLTRTREEFRHAVRSILCESVGGPEGLSEEWKALFG